MRRNSAGYALLIVLAAIVLCALMVVILMERSTSGLKSAASYRDSAQVKALVEMAQNLVQSQILDATTVNQGATTPLDERETWASQPGAIRTFTVSGSLNAIYKLYSSDQMRVSDPDLSGDVPSDWHARKGEFTDLNEPVRSGSASHYPILNPNISSLFPDANGITSGFSINDAPTGSGNLAPMPTRWIYVLKDGTLCQLGDSRIDLRANPIVGRIAFWTDDETTKVNVNTASPATINAYWDTPRAYSSKERDAFGWAQPSQNEYQRYPGHPAMVSIRSILGNLGALNNTSYFDLSPHYRWGGSEEGAKRVDNTGRISLLSNKEDRVYTTTDELLFGSNPVQLRSKPDAAQTEGLRFFLTASSRAPELNLFGQPRVSIWPIYGNPASPDPGDTRRTPYDRLIAFCSTIGGKAYYFTREDALSPTHDYSNIARNQELYAYLQSLTSTSVPGFPGTATFASKYGPDRDQILTEIFDYIRIVNLNETYQGRASNFESFTPTWKIARFNDAGTAVNTAADYPEDGPTRGAGMVVPIEIGNTRGMGRFPVIAEVGLLFVNHVKTRPKKDEIPPLPDPENPEQLQAMLVLDTITPAFGYMPWCGKDLKIELASSNLKFSVGSRETDLFPASVLGVSREVHYPPLVMGGMTPGGYDGAAYLAGPYRQAIAGIGADPYRFMSPALDLAPGDTQFFIKGGEIKINILVGGQVVQKYSINFPDTEALPLPVRSDKDFNDQVTWTTNNYPWLLPRFRDVTQGPLDGDVLHSVELANGDARLVAGYRDVPANFFLKHPDYGKLNTQFAHGMRSIRNSVAVVWKGGSAGSYVNLPLFNLKQTSAEDPDRTGVWKRTNPKISSAISSLRSRGWSGDFDNGWMNFPDGPFINKPDEGMMHKSGSTTTNTPYEGFIWSIADGLFSPLRQIPSPVMFGSLPTGVKASIPWRTLLFCPNPADPNHKGFESPKDHLLLDLFRMPVVEPYAISGPASTDGKVNMNYAIAPFSYIRRASSLYAALETLKLFTVEDSQSETYKGVLNGIDFRKRVNTSETLRQFDARFAANDIFRSATEICSLFLVPEGQTLANVQDLASGYWSSRQLTGDNSREKPYAELYPKLTTQSNTYRIHLRVQALPPSAAIPPGKSDFEFTAEYRGSCLIERYLNPNDPRLASVDPDENSLNSLYHFRVLESRQFAP